MRISRIGTDRLQVFIRPADGCAELRALVDRLEQLIDAGYDTIDVVFEASSRDRSAVPDGRFPKRGAGAAEKDTVSSTVAKVPPLARA